MELSFLMTAVGLAVVEYLLFVYAAWVPARFAMWAGPEHELPLDDALRAAIQDDEAEADGYRDAATPGSLRPERVPWGPPVRGAGAEFEPPSGTRPATVRLRAGSDPAVVRIDPVIEDDALVLKTRMAPAVSFAPYLFALLPAFVSLSFGPPVVPGLVYSVALLLGWLVVQRWLVGGQTAAAVREILDDLAEDILATARQPHRRRPGPRSKPGRRRGRGRRD